MRTALLIALAFALPGTAQANGLFVYGDSFAVRTKPYIPQDLPGWHVQQDVQDARSARLAASAVRETNAPIVHLSLGTVDAPDPEPFQRWVKRAIRAADGRCIVWPNIARAHKGYRTNDGPPRFGKWAKLNVVLDNEAEQHPNLIVVDWLSMVKAHPRWLLLDGAHVTDRGYRARAKAVAHAAQRCES